MNMYYIEYIHETGEGNFVNSTSVEHYSIVDAVKYVENRLGEVIKAEKKEH